jgi:hypothetical protein
VAARQNLPPQSVAAPARVRQSDGDGGGGCRVAAVYRDYDQAGLDAQYNLRARWPEHAAFMATWRRDGTVVRLGPQWFLDCAYGRLRPSGST